MKCFAKRLLGRAMWVSVCVMVLGLIEGQVLGQCVEHKILASDGAAGDFFSQSVSISGNVAIVGAIGNDDNGSNTGSAYIYRYDPSLPG